MAHEKFPTISIPDAHFIFRTNFKGASGPFNAEGERFFNVILEGEALEKALAYGMNVKQTKQRTPDDIPAYYIKVNVGYKYRPPIAMLINSKVKRTLTERTIGRLDDYEYEKIEMTIRPNQWHHSNGNSGVNAYLQSIYCTVDEDPFGHKYYDLPEAGDVDEIEY